MISYDVAVIGSGPAGKIAALELARKVENVVLIGPKNKGATTRTTALMMPSIHFLQNLCSWENLKASAAPLKTMRIIDGTKRLIRSPTVEFYASEIDEDVFAYNIPNQALSNTLEEAVVNTPNITYIESFATDYQITDNNMSIALDKQHNIRAQLVVAADGRNSAARKAAGIDICKWSYPQTALTLTFNHDLPHNFISTEFHTEEGPFTQVPLPGNCSALVWTVAPHKARYLLNLGEKALNHEIEERMQYLLGSVKINALPEAWPMAGMTAKKFAANRVALIGETAHLFPPIGAQGLNLTIRDVIALGVSITKNTKNIGNIDIMKNYNVHRKTDVLFRTGFVHGLNRALLSNLLPVQFIRSSGLEVLRRNSVVRNFFMREGMAPKAGLKKFLPPFLQ